MNIDVMMEKNIHLFKFSNSFHIVRMPKFKLALNNISNSYKYFNKFYLFGR